MRSPNYRLLAVLVVFAGVAAGGAYWLHGFQLHRNARLFLAKGEEALKREQFAEAASCLAWRLRLAPDDLETYPRLAALLRRRLDRAEEADLWMERLVAVNPASPRARILQAEYWRQTGRLKEAAAAAGEALRLAPDDAEALALLTECAFARGDFAQARRQALRLLEVAPERDSSYAILARIAIHAGRRDEATEWLRQGRTAAEKPSALGAMWADLLIEDGRVREAQEVVRGLAVERGGEPFTRYVEARIEYAEGRWLRAATAFEAVRPKLAGRPELLRNVDLWLGDCDGRLGRVDRQMTAYRRALTVDSAWAPARAGLAEALRSAGRVEEAIREYRELVQLADAPAGGWCDLASLLIAENRRLPFADRDWAEIDAVLKRAAEAAPGSPRVAVLRAEALLLRNRFAAAENLLQEALAAAPGEVDLWMAMVALARRQGDCRRAEKLLDEAIAATGDSVTLRLARGDLLVRQGGPPAAAGLKSLTEGIDGFSEEERLRLWRGLASRSLVIGDLAQAGQLCRQVLAARPADLEAHLTLLEVAFRLKNPSEVERVSGEIERLEGKGPRWHYGRALYFVLLAESSGKSALATAQGYLDQAGNLRTTWSRVPLLAAQISFLQGDQNGAIGHFLQAIELGVRDPAILCWVFESLWRRQLYLEAGRFVRLLGRQPWPSGGELSRPPAAEDGGFEQGEGASGPALPQGNRDAGLDQLWQAYSLMIEGLQAGAEGRTAEATQTLRDAEAMLREAVQRDQNDPDAWAGLILFLAETRQIAQAEEALRQALEASGGQAAIVWAQCCEAIGKTEDAEKHYQAALRAAPKDPRMTVWLADFYLRAGKEQEAEQQLQQLAAALGQTSSAPASWMRRKLASILAARGDPQSLRQALELVEENLTAGGSPAQDRRAKAALLASRHTPGGRREAIRLWESVLADQLALPANERFLLARLYMAEQDWAKAAEHLRALVGAAGGEPAYLEAYVTALLRQKNVREAESWLRALEESAPGDFAAVGLRAEAWFLRGRIEEGSAVLKSFLDGDEAQPKDPGVRLKLVLSRLKQIAAGVHGSDWQPLAGTLLDEAQAIYGEHAAAHPAHAMPLVEFLAQEGRRGEALQLAEKTWRVADPESITAAAGAILAGDGLSEAESQRLEAMLSAALEQSGRHLSLLAAMADLQLCRRQYDAAESLYREMIAADGKHVPALNNLALLLALQRKHLDQPLALIESAIEAAGPVPTLLDSRATVHLALEEHDKALRDVEAAIAEEPNAVYYFHKAQVLYQTSRQEAAAAALAKARQLELRPSELHPLERAAYHRLLGAAD